MISLTQTILLCSSVFAGSVVDNCATAKVSKTTYPVYGNTLEEARASMTKNHINNFDGFTTWNMPDFNCEGDGNFNVNVIIEMTLPQLMNQDAEVKPVFDTYYANLLRHENLHVGTGRNACKAISSALSKSNVTCDTKLGPITSPIFKQFNAVDIKIDKDTNHGMNDGACFGPNCDN